MIRCPKIYRDLDGASQMPYVASHEENVKGIKEWTFLGIDSDGTAAEYMLVNSRFMVPLPDLLPFKATAPLIYNATTIYRTIKVSRAQPGQSIAFVGIDALGHPGVQFAKLMGLRVVAVGAREESLKMKKTGKDAQIPTWISQSIQILVLREL
ncbi:hypothetical protein Clacol_005128 [Clathrus columnatus]|uniref:Alcohol dehydrogenase-like C-terminal domain-containing protein n=1 Tax=Clathrus columnatus TaxID=1419009 RepID=A0AAV5AG36_9AGAM|nr:hypothetical protein Clacol_005128 [Clathrus columnatus]